MQRSKSTILIGVLCLLTVHVSISQYSQVTFKHLTPENGLPVNNISSIVQDHQGFIWLGSNDGLFRYDGFAFKHYYSVEGNHQTIPNDVIQKLFIDSKGFLWVGTARGGLAKMTTSGKILQIYNSGTTSLFSNFSNRIQDIDEDDKGDLWFTTEDGLFQVMKGTDSLRIISISQARKHNCLTDSFRDFCFDESGRLWMGSAKGVHIYDPVTDEFQHSIYNPENINALNYQRSISAIYYDQERKSLWYSTWEPAIKRFDLLSNDSTTYFSGSGLPQKDYGWIAQDFNKSKNGTLWVLTRKGALLVEGSQPHIEHHFYHQPDDPSSVIGDFINGMLEDKEGTTWLATDKGISYTRLTENPFSNYVKGGSREFAFAGKEVSNVIEADPNTILVNTYAADGIFVIDSLFRVTQHISFRDDRYDWLWTSCREKFSGDIYLGVQRGMLKYDVSDHTVTILDHFPFNTNNAFNSILQMDDGVMWLSHYTNTFFSFDPRTGQGKKFKLTELGETGQIIRLRKAADGDIWILANKTGLLRFDPQSEKIVERFIPGPGGLLQSEVLFVLEYAHKILIGYETKGISLYDKDKKSFRHFAKSDGLISNSVRDALMDHNGRIWISTVNGLSRFDTSGFKFLNFTTYDGLGNIDLNALNLLSDGRIIICTSSGLISFHPDKVQVATLLEAPVITELSVQGIQIPIDSLVLRKDPVSISYNKNYFSIEYISPQYLNNHQIEYAYQLKGFDDDWIFAGQRRYTSYSNLPRGHYVFNIRSRYPEGEWVTCKTGIPFVVHAAFYSRWWFLVLVISFLIFFIYYLYHQKINRLKAEEEIRNKIARDLHDDIGSTLSGIKLISNIALQKVLKKQDDAAGMVSGIVERSEYMMDTMNDIVWSINPRHDLVENVLVRMKEYAAEMLEPAGIEFKFVMDKLTMKTKLNLSIRKDIYLIFKECINNIVKHSQCKTAVIELRQHDQIFEMTIKDDGIGFIQKMINGKGNGLYNLAARAKQIKGAISIESSPGKGTEVRLQVPVT